VLLCVKPTVINTLRAALQYRAHAEALEGEGRRHGRLVLGRLDAPPRLELVKIDLS
jgi:hypothetical protein